VPPSARLRSAWVWEVGGKEGGGSIALSVGGSLRTPTAAPSEMAA
jgi:hypothetical protein